MLLARAGKRRVACWLGLALVTMMLLSVCSGRGGRLCRRPERLRDLRAVLDRGPPLVTGASSNELTHSLNLNLSMNSIRRSVDRGGSRTAPTNRSEIGDSARGV